MADKDEMQPVCACCAKKKVRDPEEYRRLIHRLNRIEGQIRGIKGMIEKDATARIFWPSPQRPVRR